jgi:type I restriction enzyme M protein
LTLGESGEGDKYKRFAWGAPPKKQGDYAYLLHIIRSMKSTGKAACILPHGVLFRGNAEAVIREQLVRSGYLKGIIGLPPNLFYGTGEDLRRGKRRFKSDLVPATLLVDRYFPAERDAVAAAESDLAAIEEELEEMREEHCGEDGLLTETNEANEGEPPRLTAKSVKEALRRLGDDPDEADARRALKVYRDLLDKQAEKKARVRALEDALEAKIDAKYSKLTEAEIKALVADDKWLATLESAVQGELDRVSQTLTGRIRQLAERYATPLPQLTDDVAALAARVDGHLKKMGAVWE